MIAVTRRYRFSAAHVLRHPDLSDAENRRVYGKCAHPNGHGHDYGLEVTVGGEPDPITGWIVPPEPLDTAVDEAVLSRFDHAMLNEDPCFAELVPTAENIARVAREALEEPVAALGGSLLRVRVRETPKNHFDCGALR